jgi:GNAT superfamily N-acetyltransferase
VPQLVTTYYLEIREPSGFRPSAAQPTDVRVARLETPMPELNHFFYTAVGGDWYWIDRLGWSYSDWMAYLSAPGVETWVLTVRGVPAGYFELDTRSGDPEIAYFGLLPAFVGQGLGGYLMTVAIERAWELGTRVWVHTCSLDHPAALSAYQARGFREYRREVAEVTLPATSPGAWPGSGRVTGH